MQYFTVMSISYIAAGVKFVLPFVLRDRLTGGGISRGFNVQGNINGTLIGGRCLFLLGMNVIVELREGAVAFRKIFDKTLQHTTLVLCVIRLF